ncbi:MAG: hypothetical protein HYU76_14125 [Betaproteobacteria bacterium]|nr:hypothetical protein [Betaproteobacteria bacterium]
MTRGSENGAIPALRWHQHREAWAFVALRFVPALAALSLVWEVAQLPLYTLWEEGMPQQVVFAVLHCTVGDVLIGLSALLLALTATRAGPWRGWRWPELTAVATVIGVGYTGFSEWLNTVLRQSWSYSDWMPVLPVVDVGLSPLLQWIVIPPMALWLARRYFLAETALPSGAAPQPVRLTRADFYANPNSSPHEPGERR